MFKEINYRLEHEKNIKRIEISILCKDTLVEWKVVQKQNKPFPSPVTVSRLILLNCHIILNEYKTFPFKYLQKLNIISYP